MAYSTDENLEQFIPDILDHGVPGLIDGGVSTTLGAEVQAGADSVDVVSATGLQANDFI